MIVGNTFQFYYFFYIYSIVPNCLLKYFQPILNFINYELINESLKQYSGSSEVTSSNTQLGFTHKPQLYFQK